MFQSSGFFKKIQCPFFKHDLCHRPFCHYNHPKPEKEKEKEKEEEIVARFSTESSDDEALNRTPPDGVNEDVLKIVQNITPTKLREYEKRQQESHELQEKLKLVDDVDTTLSELIPETVAAIRSREDIRRGLIDSFYSKDKVQVNITSGDINNKPSTTNPQVNLDKFSKGGRIVCNCDDPDCSGFQEENADCSFSHVDIDQIEDEYTRRKMQRRLDRRKKDDSPIRTDVVIRESDFFIAPAEDPDDPPQPPEPIDDDLNDYIDRVKEEYEQKKRLEAAQLEAEKKLEAERKLEAEKKLETEKKLEAEKRNGIVEKEAVIEKEKALVEKEKSSKSEKKVIMNGKEKVDTVKTDKEKETKDRSKSREKKFETADKEKVDKDKSEKVKEGKDKEEKKKGDKDSSSSEKKQKVVDKKVLTDVDFFSPKVSESNTNSDADDVTDVNGVSDDDDDSDDEVIDTTTEKKSKIIDDIANLSKDLKKKSIKVINDKVKKKRIFIPNDDGDDGDGEKTEKKSNKNEKEADGKSTKKKKSKYEEEVDGEDKSKKKKKHDSNKDEESSRMKSKDKPSNGSSKKYDEDQIISKKDKVKKSSSDKIKNSDSRKNSESFDGAKKSRKNSDSSNSLIKDKKTGGIDLTKLKHKDSDASNSSRGAFDVICLSSSEDDDDEEITERAYSSCEELYDPDEMEHASRKLEEHFASIEKEKPDVKSVKPGEGKKRVALTNQEIQRKPVLPHKSKFMKLSYVSPSLKSAKPTEDTVLTPKSINKPIPKPSTPETSSTDDYSFGTGKKRVSHVQPKPSSDKSVDAERPKLQVDIGGKVPHIVRTKFFDKIIDEIIPKVKTKKEAFEKGIQEEADAYKRSSRKQIYINVCANIVKRIRAMPDYTGPREPLPSTKTADPMRTGQPTTKSAVKSKILNSLKSDLAKPSKTVDLIGSITKNSTNINRIQSASTAGYKKVSPKSTIPKNCIKPASSVLVKKVADQPPTLTSGKRVRTSSLSSEPMELTEDNFYEHMKQYLLSTEQLWENKYPKRDPDNPKGTIIKDYVGNTNTLKRVCCRCGKEYFMNKKGKYVTRNECHYHWGKLLRTRGRNSNAHAYSCCGADAAGDTCALCRLHVCNKVGPLANYVTTEFCVNKDSKRKVFALDCEMCYTTQGLELTRLTVIDFDLEQIIDLFVKPANPIVDYNTRFSGVTREDLADVTTTIEDIHDILLNMIDKETILLGHSLESDLNALNIIHDNVVDTALVFPHRLGLPFKRALRNLMVDYLQKVIQSGEGGHDSCEDARSCMELMKHKFREDQKSRKRAKT